jgi:VWFA-related protein
MPTVRCVHPHACLLLGAALGGALLTGPWPVAHAQQPTPQTPSPPVFREGTTFVSVDAYPRRDGQLVEGLTGADFQVFEDGVPQAVEAFQFIRFEPNPADSERRDPNTKTEGDRQAADPRNRVFVVYLDLAHTTIAGSHYARQPVLDFLTRTIGASDLFGVLTAEIPISQLVFVRRTDTLESEMLRYWTWGQAGRLSTEVRTEQERRLFECGPPDFVEDVLIPLWREDQMMTSLEHLMLRLGDLRDERKNVLFISEGWIPRGPREGLALRSGSLPQVGVGPGGKLGLGQTMQPNGGQAAWCDGEIARLASIDFEIRFRLLLTSAIQANVSFYPVDVGGLRTARTRATDTLQTLAENTDGFAVVSTNDLTGGVRRIANDLSGLYLLGYYSTNPAANGRFRQIEVKVNQPGVRVSARRGYLAPTAAMLAAAAAPRVNTGPTAVDHALGRLATSRADAEMFVAGTATPEGVHVAVELAPSVAASAAFRDGAEIRAMATRSDGVTAAASAAMAAGERIAATRIALPAGTAGGTWQVVVQATGQDQRLEQRVEVPAMTSRLVGPALGYRGTSSPRVPVLPLADARLSRRERLRVEWPVVARADGHVARLLDRAGKPLGQPLPLTQVADRPALALDLPLGSLPEGDFVVELIATQGDVSERQLLAFRVTR